MYFTLASGIPTCRMWNTILVMSEEINHLSDKMLENSVNIWFKCWTKIKKKKNLFRQTLQYTRQIVQSRKIVILLPGRLCSLIFWCGKKLQVLCLFVALVFELKIFANWYFVLITVIDHMHTELIILLISWYTVCFSKGSLKVRFLSYTLMCDMFA